MLWSALEIVCIVAMFTTRIITMHKRLIQALLGALVFVAYSTQTVAAGNDEPHDLTPALRATPLLLKMGMVNPKDGEYRQIEVVIDSGWHKTRKVKTHGWLRSWRNWRLVPAMV